MRHRHRRKPPGTATPSAYRYRASRRLYPPPANDPNNAETVRAEEIELFVTLQHLAELEELELLRPEFLAMVGHELRAPLTSIIGSTTTQLRPSRGWDRAEMREFRIIDAPARGTPFPASSNPDPAQEVPSSQIGHGTRAQNHTTITLIVLVLLLMKRESDVRQHRIDALRAANVLRRRLHRF